MLCFNLKEIFNKLKRIIYSLSREVNAYFPYPFFYTIMGYVRQRKYIIVDIFTF